jgi:GT2 family glycosyltransferase
MDTPVLTVSVLTCNRRDSLSTLLDNLRTQNIFEKCEILVVDNGSCDGTEQMLADRYPGVGVVRLAENIGCAGRNAGMKAARANIVLTLDDDVILNDADELEKTIRFFVEHPEFSCVNFKILDPLHRSILPFNWFHPRRHEVFGDSTFETDYIGELAVAFRKSVLLDAGYYPEDFFLSHEGYDLAYRIINRGHRIAYCGAIAAIHNCAPQQRTSWRNAYYDTRNYFWRITKYLPLRHVVLQVPYRLLTTFMFCVSRRQVRWYFKALVDATRGLPAQWRKREVLSRLSLRRLAEIRSQVPGLGYKLANFSRRMNVFNSYMKRS